MFVNGPGMFIASVPKKITEINKFGLRFRHCVLAVGIFSIPKTSRDVCIRIGNKLIGKSQRSPWEVEV